MNIIPAIDLCEQLDIKIKDIGMNFPSSYKKLSMTEINFYSSDKWNEIDPYNEFLAYAYNDFNIEIIDGLPYDLLKYVIIHELTHICNIDKVFNLRNYNLPALNRMSDKNKIIFYRTDVHEMIADINAFRVCDAEKSWKIEEKFCLEKNPSTKWEQELIDVDMRISIIMQETKIPNEWNVSLPDDESLLPILECRKTIAKEFYDNKEPIWLREENYHFYKVE